MKIESSWLFCEVTVKSKVDVAVPHRSGGMEGVNIWFFTCNVIRGDSWRNMFVVQRRIQRIPKGKERKTAQKGKTGTFAHLSPRTPMYNPRSPIYSPL